MSPALSQALIRLVIIFLTAGVAAIGANLTILQEAITDPVLSAMVVAVITAVLSAIGKYLGGATQPVEPTVGRAAAGDVKTPNVLSV